MKIGKTELKEGVKLRRIVDGKATYVGHEYTVHWGNWHKETSDNIDCLTEANHRIIM